MRNPNEDFHRMLGEGEVGLEALAKKLSAATSMAEGEPERPAMGIDFAVGDEPSKTVETVVEVGADGSQVVKDVKVVEPPYRPSAPSRNKFASSETRASGPVIFVVGEMVRVKGCLYQVANIDRKSLRLVPVAEPAESGCGDAPGSD